MAWFNPLSWFSGAGPKVEAGKQIGLSANASASVTFDKAMTISAFFASVRLIAELIGSMPIQAIRTDPKNGSREHDPNYGLWRLLNYQPNRYQTRTEFFEALAVNLVTWGNCYCAIERNAAGSIISLIPLMASQMAVDILADGSLSYVYRSGDSVRVYAPSSIWHVKTFGNGVVGLSTLSFASNSIGVALDVNKRMSNLSANGGKPAGLLMIDKVLSEPQRAAIRENFKTMRDGNPDNLFVLEAGMTYEQIALSPADMQLLETRRYQVEDIARFMGVPSVLINDTASSTTWGSGIQQIMDGFYKVNLRPYLERFESSIKRHLIPREDWDAIDIEFNFDSLLRADRATRLDANSKAINSGQLTPNEARRAEGMQSLAGGDKIYLNGTLVPADDESLEDDSDVE